MGPFVTDKDVKQLKPLTTNVLCSNQIQDDPSFCFSKDGLASHHENTTGDTLFGRKSI